MEQLTPEQWRTELLGRLNRRSGHIEHLWKYYDGDHRLGFASDQFLKMFGSRFGAFASNWCQIVVGAVSERLHVDGFRVSGNDTEAQDRAAEIWQSNNLDADSGMAHDEALVSGVSYALVWPSKIDGNAPQITLESASTAIVAHNPRNRRERLAGLRLTIDPAGHHVCEVFTPGKVTSWKSEHAMPEGQSTVQDITQLHWVALENEADTIDVSSLFDVVPLIELPNRPRIRFHYKYDQMIQSELAKVIPLQDAVNKLFADLMVASEFAAAPQRWATGIENKRDAKGNEISPIQEYGQRLWSTPSENTKFGQFQAADLNNYITAIETLVQHIASQSSTPMHYFHMSPQTPNAESTHAAEASLIAKTKGTMRSFGEAWEEVMRLALQIDGTTIPQHNIETIWRNPELRTQAQLADAAIKKQQLGVPSVQLWEDLEYTPEQIKRFDEIRLEHELLEMAGGKSTDMTVPEAIQKIYLGVGAVIDTAEARRILNETVAAGLDPNKDISPPAPPPAALPPGEDEVDDTI